MGWLIDPEDRGVFIYQPGQEVQVLDEPDDVLPMPPFINDFTYRVADLFGLLVL